MNSFCNNKQEPRAQQVKISEDALIIDLIDGRSISVPLVWYPRLWYGTPEEREEFEIFGDGKYLHWPNLDEDLTVEGLIEGLRSGESPKSLKKWLESRQGSDKQTA